ncbi:hypothetical protein BD311DRAFT_663929 [Dichomitus squalens]|nr:hypothetical protein BD311DRAFT_663929 [Dichomitus squalens]
MSYQEWKREPTTAQVLFGLQLPYRPPRSLVGRFFWRQRLWVEVTFALSMLEPWERFLVMVVFYLTLGLLLTGMTLYLPHHLAQMQTRAAYYLFGRDGVSTYASLGTSGADLFRSAVNSSLASIASAGSYTASLAGWGSQAAEL